MKLEMNILRYLSKEDFRVLTAVEMGMRNREIVPSELIHRIASLKYTLCTSLLTFICEMMDFALRTSVMIFLQLRLWSILGSLMLSAVKIGVGKESDIFEVATEDALKEFAFMKVVICCLSEFVSGSFSVGLPAVSVPPVM
ncbi:Serine/threonine protein kinase [Parasponia andersonii]|uniref:Serine/threonine protein kinase n=1 Tax=Parasponia andersonii TaxID=3476 RepID=A0A2P5BSJ2_PARAD|nr:Serine/threonine protein kinase [Parasponia andersonii]